MIKNTKIPEAIQPLLETYLMTIEREMPGFLVGFYLHGSIALGAFNPRLSDIDFISVVSRPCTAEDFQRLSIIHTSLVRDFPGMALEGSYLQWGDLGKFEEAIALCPYIHDGKLNANGLFDINAVTWWVLKTHGIALIGPEAHELDFNVDWDDLIAKMKQNLNTYWAGYLHNHGRIASLLTNEGIQWAILGVLRQFYTFHEHDITSKTGAGEYALTRVPERWHPLIQEAISIREQTGKTFYRSKIVRAIDAVAFLKYVIRTCNALVMPSRKTLG